MLTHKALSTLKHTPDQILWTLGVLFSVIYIVILVPYFSNGINQYSEYALTIGAYDYYDPEVAQGPDIEYIYGNPTLGIFAFWFGACLGPCLFLPLTAFQAFTLMTHWHSFSRRGKTLRIFLHVILVVVSIVGILNAPKFGAWMEL